MLIIKRLRIVYINIYYILWTVHNWNQMLKAASDFSGKLKSSNV